jgi:hypothetical protein
MEILGSQGRLWGIAVAGLHLSEEPHGRGAVPSVSHIQRSYGGTLAVVRSRRFPAKPRRLLFLFPRRPSSQPPRSPLLVHPEARPVITIDDFTLPCREPYAHISRAVSPGPLKQARTPSLRREEVLCMCIGVGGGGYPTLRRAVNHERHKDVRPAVALGCSVRASD